jgi:hypothetical protein
MIPDLYSLTTRNCELDVSLETVHGDTIGIYVADELNDNYAHIILNLEQAEKLANALLDHIKRSK